MTMTRRMTRRETRRTTEAILRAWASRAWLESLRRGEEIREERPEPVWIERRLWLAMQFAGRELAMVPLAPAGRRPFPVVDWCWAGLLVRFGSHDYRIGSWADRMVVELGEPTTRPAE